MALKAKNSTPSTPVQSAADQTWSHYTRIIEKFRKVCRSDAFQRESAEAKVRARLVAAAWEAQGMPAVDVLRLAGAVDAVKLDLEDQKQIDALYAARIAFRDRLADSLGKLPKEGWDAFYERNAKPGKVRHTVKMFELAGGKP